MANQAILPPGFDPSHIVHCLAGLAARAVYQFRTRVPAVHHENGEYLSGMIKQYRCLSATVWPIKHRALLIRY